ncbi:MAG: UvrB/UvrC motif-containing protein [Gemmatimonadota bacterium]|jgi:protein arginine kinase activator|nr:hypothetical protein [Candidatus Woesearchaeota archaeon]MDP6530167.1 UvrB/UvrC motif-containing protein [Gemmatimonadota bacterium]MDP6803204.1 UvrB/UvrC motif-containing protein [Gemmatimonadota bacterium]MDP7032440.1 UvrB/UvrC motif-containing protein [Gemmatimonadota bacterium]
MKCGKCGERPGEILYKEFEGGSVREIPVCKECAAGLGFASEEQKKAEPASPAVSLGEDTACPECGISMGAVTAESRLGCERCYEAFHEALEPLLEEMQGAGRHVGRLPGGRHAADIAGLQRELEEAVESQDFDRAAELRDRIRTETPDSGRDGS